MRYVLLFLCVCSISILYTDVVLVMEKEPKPVLAVSASTGLCVDLLILVLRHPALAYVGRPHRMISGARALLHVAIPYRVTTLVASPRVPEAWVVVGSAVSATVSLAALSGPPQQLWWRVLGSLSFFLGWVDLLRCARDGAEALRHLTLTGGTVIVDTLMALLCAAEMRRGAVEGAPPGRRELVAVALLYHARVLVSPPPLLAAAAFTTMVGLCVLSILSAELGPPIGVDLGAHQHVL